MQPPVFDITGSRINGGIGCHQAPEFDIDPNSLNNGVIGTASGIGTDLTVTRSPSLRDVVKQNGESNGIVGGVGPYSGLDLLKKVFDNTLANSDQEHLDAVLISASQKLKIELNI